ncbi:ABC transporter substrate-binding protein [Paraburkholderia sp. SIMBA_054]|uniref:ABC transporter substrate-binding protein n=1 Tax=Paraburkholderia sp. SIMBA_054 TaxID=3085795 RepID=UPI00397A5B65
MKSLAIVLLPVIVAFGHALHAEPATSNAGDTPHRIVLLVDEIKAIRNFPVVLAERLGYLSDKEMTVTVMNTRDDTPHAEMLADGRVDAVMAYYHHNIVNQSQGNATEAIVTLGVTPGAKVLVANASKERYKTLADLKGSRFIAGGAGSSKSTVANYLVLSGGNRITDYTRLGTDGKTSNTEALRNGTADFVVAPTPDGDFYEAQGVATTFADLTTVEGTKKNFGVLFPSSTVYMTRERAKTHPEIAQHLADAFVRTLRYINTHSAEEIAAIVPVEISGRDRAAYLKVLKEAKPMFATDGRMPPDGAENEWRVLAEFKPSYRSVKPEQTYTNSFVDVALSRLR